jgi:toxin secretion/phage lysis holin
VGDVKVDRETLTTGLVATVFTATAATWGGVDPWLKALFLMALLDVLAALVVACGSATVDLGTLRRGVQKKAMMAILVTSSIVVQSYVAEQVGYQVPLTTAVAGYYASLEFLSILKHAYSLGLPVPRALVDVGTRVEHMTGGGAGRGEGGSRA